MVKIAIIGANGFIGRNVARHFPNVLLITRKHLDIMDNKKVEDFFQKHPVDWIIHCAVEGGSRLEQDSKDVTFNNLKSYFSFARLGIPMVYFSSGAALWNPESPYGFSKLIIENMNHPHVKLIRIFGCFGPYEKTTRFTAAVSKGFVVIEQDRYFDFIHVNDLMYLIEKVMKESDSKLIDAVYPGPKMTLSDFAETYGADYIIKNSGLGTPYVSV